MYLLVLLAFDILIEDSPVAAERTEPVDGAELEIDAEKVGTDTAAGMLEDVDAGCFLFSFGVGLLMVLLLVLASLAMASTVALEGLSVTPNLLSTANHSPGDLL